MAEEGGSPHPGSPQEAVAAPQPLGLPMGDPERLGLVPDRLERAMGLLEEGLRTGAYPGAVALVARHGQIAAAAAIGQAQVVPEARPMRLDTVFDLASITKVVAGVTAVLVLLDAGLICLDDPVARFVPAFGDAGKRAITVRHLLTHTSGLPPWLPCYAEARMAEETYAYLCTLELEALPGTQVQYSDLGMALIRAVVHHVAGQDLPALLGRTVFAPLAMRDTEYLPSPERRLRAAATEHGNRCEQGMVARAGLHFAGWRTGVLLGEVNDGNTHYALEGISSHAGLFSTAGDLARFGQLYLQHGLWEGRTLLSAAAVGAATSPDAAGWRTGYGLGWGLAGLPPGPAAPLTRSVRTRAIFPDDPLAPPVPSWCGDLLPAGTFGHTGFTGTSLTICPEHDLLLILLTNRIHPDADRSGLDRVRARWHNAIVASIEG